LKYLEFNTINNRRKMICLIITYFRAGINVIAVINVGAKFTESFEIRTILYATITLTKVFVDIYIFYLLIRNLRFFKSKYLEKREVSCTYLFWVSFIIFTVLTQILVSIGHTMLVLFQIPLLITIRNTDSFLFFRNI